MFVNKIIYFLRKFKTDLKLFYVPVLSSIAILIWTILGNYFINIFNSGYLSTFQISSYYPITGLMIKSKFILLIYITAIITMICIKIYFTNQNFNKQINECQNNKKYYFRLAYSFVKESITLILLLTLSFFLLMVFILDEPMTIFFILDVISEISNYPFFSENIITFSVLAITVIFIINLVTCVLNKYNFNVFKKVLPHNHVPKKQNLLKMFILCIVVTLLLNSFILLLGNLASSIEISYPTFVENKITYIVVATLPNNKYLAVDYDSLSKDDKPTICIIKDITNIKLIDSLVY